MVRLSFEAACVSVCVLLSTVAEEPIYARDRHGD